MSKLSLFRAKLFEVPVLNRELDFLRILAKILKKSRKDKSENNEALLVLCHYQLCYMLTETR